MVEPEGALLRARSLLLLGVASTIVASASMTNGAAALMPWSGAASPASAHARTLACARGPVDRGHRRPGVSGQDGHRPRPRRLGGHGSVDAGLGAQQVQVRQAVPPRASDRDRSLATFPGSWTADGLRQGAQLRLQRSGQTGGLGGPDQQHTTGLGTAPERAVSTWTRG